MKKENLLYLIVSIIRKIVLFLSIFLIFNGWGVYSGEGAYALYMYSNLTTFSFWLLFLMGSVLLAIFGRVFCAICPVGEINYLMSKIGLKKPVKIKFSFLQGLSLLFVFLMVIIFNISRHPHYTSLLILSALLFGGLMGLFYSGNSFCLILCPANAFLRFYGIFSSIRIEAKNNCNIKNECPVFLNPCNVKKESCHLCLRCFKEAEGLKISLINPFKNFSLPYFNKSDLFIFSVLSGLTFMAFIRVVREVREVFVYIPYKITELFALSSKLILPLTTFFGVFVYPLMFFLLTLFLIKIFDKNSSVKYLSYFIFSTYSVHMILALVKVNSRIKFLPYALMDPTGKDVVSLRLAYNFDIPGDVIPIFYFRFILLAIPIVFYIIGLNKISKASKNIGIIISIIFTLVLSFIQYIIFKWLFVFR